MTIDEKAWLHRLDMEKTAAWQQGYAQGLYRASQQTTEKKLTFEEWWERNTESGFRKGTCEEVDWYTAQWAWKAAQENK